MKDTRDPLVRVVEERNDLRREARLLRAVVASMPGSYIESWSHESEEALRAYRAANSQASPS